jgi:hypothetical protein
VVPTVEVVVLPSLDTVDEVVEVVVDNFQDDDSMILHSHSSQVQVQVRDQDQHVEGTTAVVVVVVLRDQVEVSGNS